MSKRFKRQDYFRYPRTGTKWRRPKGLQSKQRIEKGGSGLTPKVGYGTPNSEKVTLIVITNMNELTGLNKGSNVLLSSSLGVKKSLDLYNKAKELGINVKNMKKVKKAKNHIKKMEINKKMKALEKKAKSTEEKTKSSETKNSEEKKE